MDISKEVVEQLKLNEEQVKGITVFAQNVIAEKQKEWDGKANANAEKILDGVVSSVKEKTGVTLERQQGEKYADWLLRVSDAKFENEKKEIQTLKTDLEQKKKDFKGGEILKSELDQAQAKLDEALKKYADYDVLKEKAAKADEYGQQLSGLKLEVAFNGVKPNFPETVNKYEAKAKWDEFKTNVLKAYNIELVDGVPTCIDKENQYKTVKLSELVDKNTEIQELTKGRQQAGTGAQQKDFVDIEGLPFKIQKDATTKERAEAIQKYLAEEGLKPMMPEYSKEFSRLNNIILTKKN